MEGLRRKAFTAWRRLFLAASLPLAFRAFLVAVLGTASAATFFATRQSLAAARALGERALESTALALSSSVESALREQKGQGELRGILSDRVVAYALVAAQDGTIRFHANPDLIGTKLPSSELAAWRHPEKPAGRRITLGLGTPAYEYDYPLHGPGGAPETLRLVLYLGSVDRFGAETRRLWTIVGGVLALLVAAGVALDRMLIRLLAVRRETERQERLSLIGQMTATLAHEIRNALWGVKGYAQWLDEKLPERSAGKADVAAILKGSARIEGLVDDLLLYAREETYRQEPVPLHPLLSGACSAAAAGWGGEVVTSVPGDLAAWGDEEKLSRVFLNGIRNALEAMGERGTLTVLGGKTKDSVWVRVEDTGGGLSEEATRSVFTPFFTTKTNGTGLGLAYSRKVVEGMGGLIRIENTVRGAALSVWLPGAKERSSG